MCGAFPHHCRALDRVGFEMWAHRRIKYICSGLALFPVCTDEWLWGGERCGGKWGGTVYGLFEGAEFLSPSCHCDSWVHLCQRVYIGLSSYILWHSCSWRRTLNRIGRVDSALA